MAIKLFSFFGQSKLSLNVDFQICFNDSVERNPDPAAGLIVKDHVVAIDADDPSAKVALATYRIARFDPCRAARESFVIRVPVKSALQTWRRNLERVRRVDEILDVECGAELLADFGAIPVRHASGLINEHANHRTIVGAGHFRMDQLNSMVNGGLLGKLANALLHRP